MNKNTLYRNIALFSSLLVLSGLFISFSDINNKNIFESIEDALHFLVYLCAFMWLKKRILLFGLILFLIDFQIRLLLNPFIQMKNTEIVEPILSWIGIIALSIGYVFLVLGLWSRFENKYLAETVNISLKVMLINIILGSLFIQMVIRLI